MTMVILGQHDLKLKLAKLIHH